MDSLAGAIWRTVYARNESVGEERVRLMAEYVNSELLDVYEVDKVRGVRIIFEMQKAHTSPYSLLGVVLASALRSSSA